MSWAACVLLAGMLGGAPAWGGVEPDRLDGGGAHASVGAIRLHGALTPLGVPTGSRAAVGATRLQSDIIPLLYGSLRNAALPAWLELLASAALPTPAGPALATLASARPPAG